MSESTKAIFLDRDGTINVDKDYLYRKEDFEYLPGAIEGLRKLSQEGFLLIVITNQSGIARGFYSKEDYLALDSWMKEDLRSKGISVVASYFCPHLPDAKIKRYKKICSCRKPGTELFWRAQKEFGIDMSRSFAIGDRMRDLSICVESGVKGILLSGGKAPDKDTVVCSSWEEIVERILSKNCQ